MTQRWQGDDPADTSPSQCNLPVRPFTVMPSLISRFDNRIIVAGTGDWYSAGLTAHIGEIRGEYDWWYGEIAPGVYAYSIVTEDANGFVGNPDWQELPVVFKSHIMAGLRGAVPVGASPERAAEPRVVVHRRGRNPQGD